jgi:hypothetical protein
MSFQEKLLKIYPDVLNLALTTDDKEEIFDIIEIIKENINLSELENEKLENDMDEFGIAILEAEDKNDLQSKKETILKLKSYIKEIFYNYLFSKIPNQKVLIKILKSIQSINPSFNVIDIVNKLNPKINSRKSPPKYIPRLTIYDETLKPAGYVPQFKISEERMKKYQEQEDKKYEYDFKIQVAVGDNDSNIDFIKLKYTNNKNIINKKKFESFLCDLEIFNWERGIKTQENINYFRSGDYSIYLIYLCKKLGHDLTLLERTFSKNNNYYVMQNNAIINQTYPLYDKNREDIYSKLGIQTEKYIHFPVLVYSTKELLNFYYTPQLTSFQTRYCLTQLLIRYKTSSHFTTLFIDTETKTVDYFDPFGKAGDKTVHSYVYHVLKILFPDYTILKVWHQQGLQKTEIYEKKSGITEEGFCVVWGHLILHLKLLNINMTFEDIESNILKECFDKKLSIYEVMLNYSYTMSRMIPKDPVKYSLLEKALITNN